jgi:plastocyanin
MNPLHQDWHDTGKDEQVVPVRSAKESSSNETCLAGGIPVSRKPAAILGMLIVSSLAFTYYHESSQVTGQVANTSQTVLISEDGLDPLSVSVQQGQTITWINKQSIPHILQSEDLCNANGDCLYTPTVFPGEQINFEITNEIIPGTYTYVSVTSETVAGEIVVTKGDSNQEPDDDPANALPPPPEATIPPEANEPPAKQEAPKAPPKVDTPKAPTPNNIPTNPNIGKNKKLNANLAGNTQTKTPPPINSVKKPIRQPETGASSWIVFVLSIAGLMWVTRRAFAYNY